MSVRAEPRRAAPVTSPTFEPAERHRGAPQQPPTATCWDTRDHSRFLVEEFLLERQRLHRIWGERSLPNGTGPTRPCPQFTGTTGQAADIFARSVQLARAGRTLTWRALTIEALARALAEDDPENLLDHLVATGAVLLDWMEDIDRNLHHS